MTIDAVPVCRFGDAPLTIEDVVALAQLGFPQAVVGVVIALLVLAPESIAAVRAGKHALVEKPGGLNATELRAVAERLQAVHLASHVGTRQKLLVERNEMAHTEDFTLVAAPGMNPGSLVEVSIGGHNGRHLTIAAAAADAAA